MPNESKDRILTCACELYLSDGLEGFSMRKLAEAVGVTAPALYRHYRGKEEVLLDVLGRGHDELMGYLSRALQGTTPRERFAMAGDAYLDFALDNPRYFQMIHAFAEATGLDVNEVPEDLERRICAVGNFWHDRVRECVEEGLLVPDDPERIGLTLWAHAYGLISLYLRGMLAMPEAAFREAYRDSFRRVFLGLGTEALKDVLRDEIEAEARAARSEETDPSVVGAD